MKSVALNAFPRLLGRRPGAKRLRAAGRIITREELSRDVLGRSTSPFDRSIDMHISNLRKKLGHQLGAVERIKTVRGVGYIYAQSSGSSGK